MVRLVDDGTRKGYRLLPENEIVNARLVNVEENSFNDQKDGSLVENLRWVFSLEIPEDPDLNGKEIRGTTSRVYTDHPNCKSYLWVTNITGVAQDPLQGFDTDMLIGKPCRILIGHRKDTQNRTWMKVKEVLPPAGRRFVQPPQPEDPPF